MSKPRFGERLLDIFFPPKCPFCSKHTVKRQAGCCETCKGRLAENHEIIRLAVGQAKREVRCLAPFVYEGLTRKAILALKFHHHREYAPLLGALLASQLSKRLDSFQADMVTAVPLSKARQNERGYNQSALLAKTFAREIGLPYEELLCKVRENQVQHTLSADERENNVQGVYAAAKQSLIKGKNVLLVDDIVTTGSTLSECAKVLLSAGAKEVLCAAMAYRGLYS